MGAELDRTCGVCGAFRPYGQDPNLGVVGICARQMRAFPVTSTGTCTEWRARGTAAEREPERPAPRAARSRTTHAPEAPRRPTLPKEIELDMDIDTFRTVLAEVLREELGIGEATLGGRWEGGELVLKPGKEGTQEKRIPIDAFFHKIVMLRDRLRVLEQKVNAHAGLTAEDKVTLQQYVTGCYGTLTTFNVLFADPKRDGFQGAGRDE